MTKRLGPLKVNFAILCDDIRRETNNKYSLMGVLQGDVLIASFPSQIGLAIFSEMEGPAGRYQMELRLSGPGKQSAILDSLIDHQSDGLIALATPRIDLLADKPGRFRVDVRIDGGKWVNLISKKFLLNDPPTS